MNPRSARADDGPLHEPLVALCDVAKHFDVSAPWLNRVVERKPRAILKAVDGVDLAIARGETLSEIAVGYRVSTAALRESNSLKSDQVRVGQVLTIPRG